MRTSRFRNLPFHVISEGYMFKFKFKNQSKEDQQRNGIDSITLVKKKNITFSYS